MIISAKVLFISMHLQWIINKFNLRMKVKASIIAFCLLALVLAQNDANSKNKGALCKQCTRYCPYDPSLCCANPSANQWTCFPSHKSANTPITCSLQNMCQPQNTPPSLIYVKKWLTSNGAQPDLTLNNNKNRSTYSWTSKGFAPGWIQMNFQPQTVKTLNLDVCMQPNGKVAYKIIVDNQVFIKNQENLIHGTKKVFNINKLCSKINILIEASPSWVCWTDMYITG